MAIEIGSKVRNIAGKGAQGAKSAAGKGGEIIKSGAIKAAGKAQDAQRELQLKRYNPFFWEDYVASGFDNARVVVIVDDDERKGIEVCEGAVGWQRKYAKQRVMFLYQEQLDQFGFDFAPRPMCGSVYLKDPFDGSRYVEASSYFDNAKEEQIAELLQIAHLLGAKEVSIDICEERKTAVRLKGGTSSKIKVSGAKKKEVLKDSETVDATLDSSSNHILKESIKQSFEGGDEPQRPELKWFRNDPKICALIDSRCNGFDMTSSYERRIDHCKSGEITVDFAKDMDTILEKVCGGANFSFIGMVKDEKRKSFVLKIEF